MNVNAFFGVCWENVGGVLEMCGGSLSGHGLDVSERDPFSPFYGNNTAKTVFLDKSAKKDILL